MNKQTKLSRDTTLDTLIGEGGETHQQRSATPLTTNQGTSVSDNQNSLRAGVRGPTLLEDFILREKITHFDHERIPERIVHARGSAAHGYFELTKSLKKYTRSQVLTEVGVQVPVFCRFSTVAGGAGSVDTPRDVRGFAVKFYTSEGNWDLVGNNIPVFFIQDAMKFPDLIHSVKMEPDRGYPQAASAHDTFWDFISLMPESMHMVMWAMSDRTLPRSLRMMEGFGVHSFRLINEKGDATFVRYHWLPKLGLQSTTWDETVKIAGADPDYHRRDLREAIESGAYPEWELAVQLFDQETADSFPFDHLDSTKLIPEELVPLTRIGRMVLNRNPDNFFAETEQVAFCPSHLVPGMDFSEDPLLHGRLHSYLDTQLSRLGGPNFHQLPINQPKCPFANMQRDGLFQMQVPKGRVAYEPNSLDQSGPRERSDGFMSHGMFTGAPEKTRIRAELFADHFSQARMFFRSQSDAEQTHIISALVFELSKVETPAIRERVVSHLCNIDTELAERVAAGLGIDVPAASAPAREPIELDTSDALRLINKYPATSEGRTLAVIVGNGSNSAKLATLKNSATAAGASVKILAQKIGGVKLSDGKLAAVDGTIDGNPSQLFDAIALVLSDDEEAKLSKDAGVVEFVANAYNHLKSIAASASDSPLLVKARVEPDDGVFTLDAMDEMLTAISQRFWQRDARLQI